MRVPSLFAGVEEASTNARAEGVRRELQPVPRGRRPRSPPASTGSSAGSSRPSRSRSTRRRCPTGSARPGRPPAAGDAGRGARRARGRRRAHRRARPGARRVVPRRPPLRVGRRTPRRTRHSSSRVTSRSTERGRARRPPRARDPARAPATLDEFRGLFSESPDPRQWPHVATGAHLPARDRRARGAARLRADRARRLRAPTRADTARDTRPRSCARRTRSGCSSTTASPRRARARTGTRWASSPAAGARRCCGSSAWRGGMAAGRPQRPARAVRAEVGRARRRLRRAEDDRRLPGGLDVAARPTGRAARALAGPRPAGSRTVPCSSCCSTPRSRPTRRRAIRSRCRSTAASATPTCTCRAPTRRSSSRCVERFRDTPFVLLHCYPFVREAGWLAHVYGNVWFDLSLTIPHVSRARRDAARGARARARVEAALRLGRRADARALLPRGARGGATRSPRCSREALEPAEAERPHGRSCARTRSRSTASTTGPSRWGVADPCSRRRPPRASRACGRRCTAHGARRRPRRRRSRGRR